MTHVRIIAFLLAVSAIAGTRQSAAQAADAYAATDSVTVGDRFGLVVAVGHDGSRTAVFPHELLPDSLARTAAFALGDFEVLDIRSSGSRPYSSGGLIDSVIYETTTFAIDTARVAGIPVSLAGQTDTLTLVAGSVILPVTSLVPADAEDIRDLKPLAEFPRVWWPWIVGLLALAAVAAALWYYRRRNLADEGDAEDVEPLVPPYEQAMQRLHELERIDVDMTENVKPYYVEISDVLRTYLGRRVRVKALESTTRELLESLEHRTSESGVPDSVVNEARQILGQADLVKFADDRPVWETSRRVMTLTKSTIETTERALRSREDELRHRAAESASEHASDDSTSSGDGAPTGSGSRSPSAAVRPNGGDDAGDMSPASGSGGAENVSSASATGGIKNVSPAADSGGASSGPTRPSDPFAPPESR